MAGYKNIDPHGGVKFGDGQKRNDKGRPKKIYTVLKEKGFSKDDIVTAFKELAFYTKKELDELLKNSDDLPIITVVIIRAFQSSVRRGDFSKVKEILEHVIGRPVNKTELTGKDGNEINFILPKPTNDTENDEIR